jgi:hypothetical protein
MRHGIKMIGLVAMLAASACGGDGGNDVGKFVGTWRATAGTITRTCPGYAAETEGLTGNAVWNAGVSSDLTAITALTPSCPLMADVTNATASGAPGQSCTDSDGTGLTATVAFASYTFVLSPDGRTAAENSSGQITFFADGASLVCSFNETGSYQKISN